MLRVYLWPILLATTVFAVSSTSELATPDLSFAYSLDKVIHFFIFGLIATSIIRIPCFFKKGATGWIYAVILVACFGAFDEWWQSMTPNRTMEFADWIADVAGAIVAASLYCYWARYRGVLEYPVGARRTA